MFVAYRPAAGLLRVASNVRVADGRKKLLIKRSLSDMQIARLFLFEVNGKNALCAYISILIRKDSRESRRKWQDFGK